MGFCVVVGCGSREAPEAPGRVVVINNEISIDVLSNQDCRTRFLSFVWRR